jgi:hypothetical protein
MRTLNITARIAIAFAAMQNRAVVVINVVVHLLHLLKAYLRTLGKTPEGKSSKRSPSFNDWHALMSSRGQMPAPAYAYATNQRRRSQRQLG